MSYLSSHTTHYTAFIAQTSHPTQLISHQSSIIHLTLLISYQSSLPTLISNRSSRTTPLTALITQPLISHHSSHTAHHTPLFSHHSSHATHLTPLISHQFSHTTHLTPLISNHSSHTSHNHSSHTSHHTPLISQHSKIARLILHHSSFTTRLIPNTHSNERHKASHVGLSVIRSFHLSKQNINQKHENQSQQTSWCSGVSKWLCWPSRCRDPQTALREVEPLGGGGPQRRQPQSTAKRYRQKSSSHTPPLLTNNDVSVTTEVSVHERW